MSSNLWIQTHSGRSWSLIDPKPGDVHLDDMAHALSKLCRYTGHTRSHYSVAQHSVLAAERVAVLLPGEASLAMAALLHDAHEAYLGDMSAPLKWTFNHLGAGDAIRRLERSHDEAIAAWAGIGPHLFNHPVIKQVDLELLSTEKRDLLNEGQRPWGQLPDALTELRIEPMNAVAARDLFCAHFHGIKEAMRLKGQH